MPAVQSTTRNERRDQPLIPIYGGWHVHTLRRSFDGVSFIRYVQFRYNTIISFHEFSTNSRLSK